MNWTAQCARKTGGGAIWCGLELHICAVTAENGQLDGKEMPLPGFPGLPSSTTTYQALWQPTRWHVLPLGRIRSFKPSSRSPQIRSAWELAAGRHARAGRSSKSCPWLRLLSSQPSLAWRRGTAARLHHPQTTAPQLWFMICRPSCSVPLILSY